ncbi:MAG: hypothetical protein M0Z95_16175, partial [Actinomycetota bacterium]|nr:hypothetical protein [Actinomycetota bacterium]
MSRSRGRRDGSFADLVGAPEVFPSRAVSSSTAALLLVASSLLLVLQSASPASAAASISPLTASGCNQDVCIYVEGSGTQVTYWSTTASLPASMCTVANYWANGVLVYEGNTKCGSSGGRVSSYWSNP